MELNVNRMEKDSGDVLGVSEIESHWLIIKFTGASADLAFKKLIKAFLSFFKLEIYCTASNSPKPSSQLLNIFNSFFVCFSIWLIKDASKDFLDNFL